MMLGNKEFVYSKEGFKEFEVLINQKKFNYLNTRTRYCVMIQFEVIFGMFKYFNDKRNHEFANQKEFCNLKSRKRALIICESIIGTMVSANIKASHTYIY